MCTSSCLPTTPAAVLKLGASAFDLFSLETVRLLHRAVFTRVVLQKVVEDVILQVIQLAHFSRNQARPRYFLTVVQRPHVVLPGGTEHVRNQLEMKRNWLKLHS